MKRLIIPLLLLMMTTPSWAQDDCCQASCCDDPWFTGPLLTPSGHVVQKGHVNFEPYLFVTHAIGAYDSHWKAHNSPKATTYNVELELQVGLSENWDAGITPQFSFNEASGSHHWVFNDFVLQFDYQLYKAPEGCNYPDIKFSIAEVFPTGKYENLTPSFHGTDVGGGGSYVTIAGIVFTKLTEFSRCHFLSTRFALGAAFPSHVHVSGFNAYGGGFGTSGTVRPGIYGRALLGLEYSLTQNWALALDIMAITGAATTFSGNPGTTGTGDAAAIGGPAAALPSLRHGVAAVGGGPFTQFSLAPAIEYNLNENLGWIAGVWFSVAGRNIADFFSGVVAFNVYY